MNEDEREYERVIADCTEALDASPNDADRVAALNKRGLAFTNKGDYHRGYEDFTEAILLGPTAKALRTLLYNRGRCQSFNGVYDEAIDDLTEAIRLNPKDADAFVMRGLAWQNLGDIQKAIADYNFAIRNNPDSADAYHNRGNAWVHLGRFRKGIADLTQAIRRDPQCAASHTSRGIAWRRKARYAEALADYERALELDPHSAQRRFVLGGFLACCPQCRYRDGARALELMTEACELTHQSNAAYLNILAAAHAEQGDFRSAITVLHEALSRPTDDYDKEDARFCLALYEAGEPWRLESPTWRERWS